MTKEEIREIVVTQLGRIAPEIGGSAIDPRVNLREEYDLDSMDFLNLMIALHETVGVDIPEADYGQLVSLDAAVAYLAAKVSAPGAAPRKDTA